MLSDARFVEEFVRSRVERGHGPVRIRADLRARGIEDEQIDAAVTQPTDFWVSRISRVRAKKFGEQLPSDRMEWARQARFLAQRGYPSDVIYLVLNDAND
ncbi:MAG: regulatory protein RecX [Gammaproteobacteria bacterium]|nr:regulatory protein RecX [Gammaproteobacteria bacterium]